MRYQASIAVQNFTQFFELTTVRILVLTLNTYSESSTTFI